MEMRNHRASSATNVGLHCSGALGLQATWNISSVLMTSKACGVVGYIIVFRFFSAQYYCWDVCFRGQGLYDDNSFRLPIHESRRLVKACPLA